MNQEILFLYKRDLNKLKEEILAYTVEENIWKIDGKILNSAGNLAMHLCGNLRHFIGHVIGGTAYQRNRDLEFAQKGVSRKKIIAEIDQTIASMEKVIPNIDPASFENHFPILVFKEPYTIIQMIIHLHGHLNYHLGQVNYHRRLIES